MTVTVSTASQTPTGNVTLSVDGGATLTQALAPAGGFTASATFTLPSPSAGTHTLQANYALQPPFRASNASGSLVVNPASSSTTLNVTPSTAVTGQSLTLTATAGSVSGTPTGTVQFFADATPLGAPIALSGGTATTTTSLNAGMHAITATYSGNSNVSGSWAVYVIRVAGALPSAYGQNTRASAGVA